MYVMYGLPDRNNQNNVFTEHTNINDTHTYINTHTKQYIGLIVTSYIEAQLTTSGKKDDVT